MILAFRPVPPPAMISFHCIPIFPLIIIFLLVTRASLATERLYSL